MAELEKTLGEVHKPPQEPDLSFYRRSTLSQFPESLEARVTMLADATCSDIAQRYKMQQVLGSGAQATVYQAVAKRSQCKTAVKVHSVQRLLSAMTIEASILSQVLDQNELKDDDLFDALRMEIMILKQLKHPYANA